MSAGEFKAAGLDKLSADELAALDAWLARREAAATAAGVAALDAHYRQIDSVAGATILGNGKVALIVDVDFIASTAARHPSAIPLAAAA